ncbi:SH3 domain-containing protein [Pseudomonas sp. SAS7]|uniref:hypothetical protein n=1 Tax=Pseudomonas sp. SAS7 TaxID=3156487 RepID=UPI003F9CE9EB
MRKKGQSWFLPLLVLFVMVWAIGRKDSPKTEPPVIQAPVSTLASTSSPAPEPSQASAPEHFVNADKLNLRAQPGGTVISSLKRGEKVQVYEQKAEWAHQPRRPTRTMDLLQKPVQRLELLCHPAAQKGAPCSAASSKLNT